MQQTSPVSSIHSGSTQRPNYPIPNQHGQSTLVHYQHQQSLKQQHFAQQPTQSQPVAQQQQMQSHQMLQHPLINRSSVQLSHDVPANISAKAQSSTSSSSGGNTVQYPASNSISVGQHLNIANNNINNNNSNNNNNNGNASANSNNQKQEQRLTHEQVKLLILQIKIFYSLQSSDKIFLKTQFKVAQHENCLHSPSPGCGKYSQIM